MYRLVIERQAEKDLIGLPSHVMKRLARVLRELPDNPFPAGSLNLSRKGENRRVRVGDYRIIYQVSESLSEVRILKVGHRKDVYR